MRYKIPAQQGSLKSLSFCQQRDISGLSPLSGLSGGCVEEAGCSKSGAFIWPVTSQEIRSYPVSWLCRKCHQRPFSESNRTQLAHGTEIIHGNKVPDGLMLYMASVQNNREHICGGFLISEDFVITAAHCDEQNPTSVVLGTHNLKKADDGTIRYGVTRSYTWPDSVSTCDTFLERGIVQASAGNNLMLTLYR
ncbi:hypothetical protein CHARACLAT_010951 [Characodon lateralis]|uniref:Peptidase S1 domain-containing protein n=1 Tax=Characodon lateralis TaxID=208331 RepID=A0ABU7DFJ1_9TELE|nr:hypothetical protein [Characodon lateralis]